MKFVEIEARFGWFAAQADSWTELSEQADQIAAALRCVTLKHEDARFHPIYDAYETLVATLTSGTDGETGYGYGAGATACKLTEKGLILTGGEYARAEAENTSDARAVERMIQNDQEKR